MASGTTAGDLSGKRVAAYARFSTDRQNPASVGDQFAKVSRWSEQRGGVIAPELTFSDEAVSGAVRDRPGLLALLRAVEEGRVDVILVEDLGRLSRDTEDSSWLRKRLEHHRVRLVCIDDGIDTAREGAELMGDVMASFKALYRRETANKTLRGMEAKARAGLATSALPYGYRSVACEGGRRKEIDPERAPTIRRVFAMYLEGCSYATIAEKLNADGVPPPRGSRSPAVPSWQVTTIRWILRNTRYGGVGWDFGATQWVRDPDTRRRVPRKRAKPLVEADRPDLAIVDAATFEAVQHRLSKTRKRSAPDAPKPRRRQYLLSGLLVCGECGAPMSIHGGDETRRYYGCAGARTRGTCSNRLNVQEQLVRERFLSALSDRLTSPEAHAEIRAAIEEALRELSSQTDGERQRLQARIQRNQQRAARLTNAIADGDSGAPATVLAAIADQEAQIRSDQVALAALEDACDLDLPSVKEIASAVTSLRALTDDIPRGRETLRGWLDEGVITMEPREGYYVARAGVLPLMLLGGPPSFRGIAGAGFEPTTFGL